MIGFTLNVGVSNVSVLLQNITGFAHGKDEFKIVAVNATLPFTLNQSGYTYATGSEGPCVERLKKMDVYEL